MLPLLQLYFYETTHSIRAFVSEPLPPSLHLAIFQPFPLSVFQHDSFIHFQARNRVNTHITLQVVSSSRSRSFSTLPAPYLFRCLVLQGMRCKESTFELLNACELLKEHFPCTKCAESYGSEQPCYVELNAPALNVRGSVNVLRIYYVK